MKSTKRIVWTIAVSVLGIGLLMGLIYGGWFYYTYLQGAPTAFLEAPAEVIEKATTPVVTPLGESLPFLDVPEGFIVQEFSNDLQKPRTLVKDPNGVLLVSDQTAGTVVALHDEDQDGHADSNIVVASELDTPHGLAFYCAVDPCKLYIAEEGMISAWDYDTSTYLASNREDLVSLPTGGRHSTRSILFLPPPNQSTLLVSIGSACDTCIELDSKRGTVMAVEADGTNLRPFADGLRNAVFMTTHPVTGATWVTEMGRDFLGDDLPPDEINILEDGRNFGWPYCYGMREHDDIFDPSHSNGCDGTLPAHIDLQAHSAPLGLDFFPEEGWPEEYQNDLLVAYHGSWNRTVPTGYKIVRMLLDSQGNYEGREDFITGWLTEDEQSIGRPADVLIEPNGEIFISDDKAGVIYRAMFHAPQ